MAFAEKLTAGEKMKAISLHQPWATWIAVGTIIQSKFRQKTIETRYRPTRYRGDLLIVSTKKPKYFDYPLGKALCVVRVVGCREMAVSDERDAMRKWDYGLYAWILEDIRRIDPFDVKGSQGFYEVDYAKSQ
ncbi:hypothetical protein LCGC14_1276050 [marine sediment metagenome]|uniref:ASCH domain-containing protein n=1 Tax=marine sediment metagenome TaxID=412755 RepID=A0A0F9LHT9_9ZZZZ